MNKILGYEWEQIQRAQQGGKLHNTIDLSKPVTKPTATEDDLAAIAKHGVDGLRAMGLFGVLDRLGKL